MYTGNSYVLDVGLVCVQIAIANYVATIQLSQFRMKQKN